MSEGAASNGGTVVGVPSGSGEGSGRAAIDLDGLVNGALKNMEGDAAQPTGELTAPAPDPEDLATGEPEIEEADPDEPASTKGTKEDPYTINELKTDRFIKIKVDGEERVISERELGNGYIREQSFLNSVRQAKSATDEANAIVARAKEGRQRDMTLLTNLIENGDHLFKFMMGNEVTEAALRAASIRYANESKAWKADPSRRVQFEAQRERGRLDKERQEWETQRAKSDRERQEREVSSRVQMELKPAWEAALRESGFPNPQDPEFQAEVKARVYAVTQRTGKRVSPAEFKDCVIRAARFLGAAPGQKKPAPAARPAPKPLAKTNGNGQRNPYRVGSVDHIMHGMKPPRV